MVMLLYLKQSAHRHTPGSVNLVIIAAVICVCFCLERTDWQVVCCTVILELVR